jgi:inhibitor of KinA sporulation pathway (predicted exonuclease)
MLILSLDLEMNQPSRNIIQIGACACDLERGLIVAELKLFINPHEMISPSVTQLTGIKNEQVKKGISLEEGFEKLAAFHAKYRCSPLPITWGGDDLGDLRNELKSKRIEHTWPFSFKAIDVKSIYYGYAFARRLPVDGGLKSTMLNLGLCFDGKNHDALDDSKNTFVLAHHLIMSRG